MCFKINLLWKIINHHIPEGKRESHPRVHDLQHPRLGKPRRGLYIIDSRIWFPCPFRNAVIDSINLYQFSWKINQASLEKSKCNSITDDRRTDGRRMDAWLQSNIRFQLGGERLNGVHAIRRVTIYCKSYYNLTSQSYFFVEELYILFAVKIFGNRKSCAKIYFMSTT